MTGYSYILGRGTRQKNISDLFINTFLRTHRHSVLTHYSMFLAVRVRYFRNM